MTEREDVDQLLPLPPVTFHILLALLAILPRSPSPWSFVSWPRWRVACVPR